MGRKNRKKKNRNNGSSTGGTATATTTATTTMRFSAKQLGFTKNQMKKINNEKYGLKGYPKSMDFASGYKHYLKHEYDEAIASFIRGAKTVGCVGCMFLYAFLQRQLGNIHLSVPLYFEAALRGHTTSMSEMVHYYNEAKPQPARAFQNFWIKIVFELGDTFYSEEERLADKKTDRSICANCGKEGDYEDMTSKKWCGGCRFYSYCRKDCQRECWKTIEDGGGNHIGECRQLKILKHNYRHYAKDIREAIIRGEDPRTIDQLQRLRTLLGLSRPKEEYEDLLSLLSDDDKNDTSQSPNRFEYIIGNKDGTVCIGSTPNLI